MKLKKFLTVLFVIVLAFSFTGCGKSKESSNTDSKAVTSGASDTKDKGAWTYSSIKLGEDYTDLKATIKWLHHKTDRDSTSGGDGKIQEYIAEFNKEYPNITVQTEGITDYANEALLRLSSKDWGDIMFIPAVDKKDLPTYFMPYGKTEDMKQVVNFANNWEYDGNSYGIAYMANANGIIYNKAVFAKAGITTLPKTPDEFIADLKLIKEKTDVKAPLYTNYAAKWTMGAWDAYVGAVSTGDYLYFNQKMVHTANPFKNPGDGSGAYNVYKILYDAVAQKLIEDDYTTTDWEGCKAMLNNGKIGCMVLGSWAYQQMVAAGDHGDDIGYMPFPITVGNKQYVVSAPDYNYGINANSSDDNKLASTIFVKWMTEKSNWSYNEVGLPVNKTGESPKLFDSFKDCEVKEQEQALAGEESLLNDMNSKSELNIYSGGDSRVMKIVENADTGKKTYDQMVDEWNKAWSNAQKKLGIEVKY